MFIGVFGYSGGYFPIAAITIAAVVAADASAEPEPELELEMMRASQGDVQ